MNIIYAIIILALLTVGGFYLVFNQIADLRSDFKNLELSFEIANKNKQSQDANASESANESEKENKAKKEESTAPKIADTNGIIIPTAIIFETQSSPLLQPQTKMIVTVESAVKKDDGMMVLNLKVFSSEATSYSAFEARDFFEMVRLDTDNQKPLKAEGQFNSIPPKSAVYGTVTFKAGLTEQKIILQIGAGTDLKFYEFDFEKKSYKETVIG